MKRFTWSNVGEEIMAWFEEAYFCEIAYFRQFARVDIGIDISYL